MKTDVGTSTSFSSLFNITLNPIFVCLCVRACVKQLHVCSLWNADANNTSKRSVCFTEFATPSLIRALVSRMKTVLNDRHRKSYMPETDTVITYYNLFLLLLYMKFNENLKMKMCN